MSPFDLSSFKQILTEINSVPCADDIKNWNQLLIYIQHKNTWSKDEVIQLVTRAHQLLLRRQYEEYSYIS